MNPLLKYLDENGSPSFEVLDSPASNNNSADRKMSSCGKDMEGSPAANAESQSQLKRNLELQPDLEITFTKNSRKGLTL